MMWQAFFSALAFVFVLEGILPFLSPKLWRRSLLTLLQQTDVSVRVMGLLSMLVGVLIMYLVRSFAGE
jgi:uncharacterized protein YjeT (DUF2065 family)